MFPLIKNSHFQLCRNSYRLLHGIRELTEILIPLHNLARWIAIQAAFMSTFQKLFISFRIYFTFITKY